MVEAYWHPIWEGYAVSNRSLLVICLPDGVEILPGSHAISDKLWLAPKEEWAPIEWYECPISVKRAWYRRVLREAREEIILLREGVHVA